MSRVSNCVDCGRQYPDVTMYLTLKGNRCTACCRVACEQYASNNGQGAQQQAAVAARGQDMATVVAQQGMQANAMRQQQAASQYAGICVGADHVDGRLFRAATAELDAARKRIEKLEGLETDQYMGRTDAEARANRLSDECGALRTERDDLLRENAVLRRKLETFERKAGKR